MCKQKINRVKDKYKKQKSMLKTNKIKQSSQNLLMLIYKRKYNFYNQN
jgi:hypothetical protein